MAEYIKRHEVLDDVRNTMFTMSMCLTKDELDGMRMAQQIIAKKIETFPSADVVPVRHGRWIKDCDRVMGDGWTYTQRHCSECGGQSVECVNYCQFCGALMDKDGDEE